MWVYMDTSTAIQSLAYRGSPRNPVATIPLASADVAAGFPSPAEDHEESGLDLTRRFIRHPTATFFVRASGESLTGIGIFPGDFLAVDRSRTPHHDDVVIALVEGSFTAKRYFVPKPNEILLASANPAYPSIPWADGCEIWGVVTSVHRDLLPGGGGGHGH